MFDHRTYLIRRKLFKLLGAAFHVYDRNASSRLIRWSS